MGQPSTFNIRLTDQHWDRAEQLLNPYLNQEHQGLVCINRAGKHRKGERVYVAQLEVYDEDGILQERQDLDDDDDDFPCSFIIGPGNEICAIQHEYSLKKVLYYFSELPPENQEKSLSKTTVKLALTRKAWNANKSEVKLEPENAVGELSTTGMYVFKTKYGLSRVDTHQKKYGLAAKTAYKDNRYSSKGYCVIKFVEFLHYRGMDLFEYFRHNRGRITFDNFLKIIFGCCLELYRFQTGRLCVEPDGQGHIHRDIKPENFAIDPKSGKVYIIDYETAIREEILEQNARLVGTCDYQAPETKPEAKGFIPRTYLQKSDVYSMGNTIKQLIEWGQLNECYLGQRKKIVPRNNIKAEMRSVLLGLMDMVDSMTKEDYRSRYTIREVLEEFPKKFPQYFEWSESRCTILFKDGKQRHRFVIEEEEVPELGAELEEKQGEIEVYTEVSYEQQPEVVEDFSSNTEPDLPAEFSSQFSKQFHAYCQKYQIKELIFDGISKDFNTLKCQAISAAITYLDTPKGLFSHHGSHGIEKTHLLIRNLITKNLNEEDVIKTEVQKYLEAKGEYRRGGCAGFFFSSGASGSINDSGTRRHIFKNFEFKEEANGKGEAANASEMGQLLKAIGF